MRLTIESVLQHRSHRSMVLVLLCRSSVVDYVYPLAVLDFASMAEKMVHCASSPSQAQYRGHCGEPIRPATRAQCWISGHSSPQWYSRTNERIVRASERIVSGRVEAVSGESFAYGWLLRPEVRLGTRKRPVRVRAGKLPLAAIFERGSLGAFSL